MGEWAAARPRSRLKSRKYREFKGLKSNIIVPSERQWLICDFTGQAKGPLIVRIERAGDGVALSQRISDANGTFRSPIALPVKPGQAYQLAIYWRGEAPTGLAAAIWTVPITTGPAWTDDSEATYLPHWTGMQRAIHHLCRSSRLLNQLVAAIEMRLGREEVLSLPHYVSLCPTGQCNALCAFCSVTINRTGIIKSQLPFDGMARFLAPLNRIIEMYGLEGNGEPTLFREFDELLATLLSGGAKAYLISNGSTIRPEQIPLLLALDSINFSINAASAETHREVMKLKNFEHIIWVISELVRARGRNSAPWINVSMVVDTNSVHEAVDFLELTEQQIGVDAVHIRPLSELGNDLGTVEDQRDIVPFESDVEDMVEAVTEYLTTTPRRAQVYFNPDNFKSFRPDTPGRIPHPRNFADHLLSPRQSGYLAGRPATINWMPRRIGIECDAGDAAEPLLTSVPIAVQEGVVLTFRATIEITRGELTVEVLGSDGLAIVAETRGVGRHELALSVATGNNDNLIIRWLAGNQGTAATVLLPRQYKPAENINRLFKLPHARRWQRDHESVVVQWETEARFRIHAHTPANHYLYRSYAAPCVPGTSVHIKPQVTVILGELGVGILDEKQERWLANFRFAPGSHSADIEVPVGENQAVHVVLYPLSAGASEAVIDWGDAIAPLPEKFRKELVVPAVPVRAAAVPPQTSSFHSTGEAEIAAPSPSPHANSPDTAAVNTKRAKKARSPRFYCQKPWTDLANFSVDGRLDVCCIATGPSQQRYALGNMLTDRLQDIWNGPVIQEFRRTVNSGTPLPPCQRCPMHFQYAGVFFNKYSWHRRFQKVMSRCETLPVLNKAVPPMRQMGAWIIDRVLFDGFK